MPHFFYIVVLISCSGLKDFKGQVLHTHEYLTPQGFENKRIMIIGVGNSGCDAAVELSKFASQVSYIITRLEGKSQIKV